jgi:hypothetical protein
MEPPLLRLLILRGVLIAIPFGIWFAWTWWAKRNGREIGATPWAWLFTAGALLFGVSFMATTALRTDNRHMVYVPGEVTADGRVTEGHFEKGAPAPR